jgi:two-component system nitrate/nitrite response regulator NarL
MTGAAGRPARPIKENAPFKEFAEQLRELRRSADLTFRKLSERTKYSIAWLSEAESGQKLPSLEGVLAFATACGADCQVWTARWHEAGGLRGGGPRISRTDRVGSIDLGIVDDHQILLDMFRVLFESTGSDIRVVGTATTVDELLAGPGRHAQVVLLDFTLDDGTTGEGNIAAILAAGPAVLVFSGSGDPSKVRAALQAGAIGYLLKAGETSEIVSAVKEAAAGREWISPRLGYVDIAPPIRAEAEIELGDEVTIGEQGRTVVHDRAQAALLANLQEAAAPKGPGTRMPPPAIKSAPRDDTRDGGISEQQVTAVIIEDHPVVTEGVMTWIRADPRRRVRVVATGSDLTELYTVRPQLLDVVILDLELAGDLVTPQIPELVAAGYRVVAFSGHSDPAIVMETLDNGAHAYVSKEEGRDHLIEAVLAAAADRPYVTRSQARAMLADQRPARPALSQQEKQALLLWFQGMSKTSVGRRMSISENTVRQYINRARAKYAASGRTAQSKDALLARAIEDGVIKPGEIMPYISFAHGTADLPTAGS